MHERLEERERIRDARSMRAALGDRTTTDGRGGESEQDDLLGLSGVKRAFLDHAGRSIARARQRAGLSNEDVARTSGVSAGVVDALEAALPVALTMEQYVDLALACGSMPLDITLGSVHDVREFASEVSPEARSAQAFDAWLARRSVRQAVLAAGNRVRKSS